jgi:hypothetical protein
MIEALFLGWIELVLVCGCVVVFVGALAAIRAHLTAVAKRRLDEKDARRETTL